MNGTNGDDFIDESGSAHWVLVNARRGDDTILGSAFGDLLFGGRNDDTITGNGGNDWIFGGRGFDIAAFNGSIFDFSLDHFFFHSLVTDLNTADGDEGTDRLFGIEALQFDDHLLFIDGTNNGPLITASNQTTDEDSPVTFTIDAIDFDGDTMAVDSVVYNGLGTLTLNSVDASGDLSANLTFDPGSAFQSLGVGDEVTETATITVSDGNGGVTTQTFEILVTGVNDAPIANAGVVSGDEDTVINGSLVATDIDGDSLTFALDTDATNGSVVVNTDGTYSYTPDTNYNGNDSFTYTVSDGNGGVDTETVAITVNSVNDAPELTTDGDPEHPTPLIDLFSVDANEADGEIKIDLFDFVTDIDSPILTFSVITIVDLATNRGITIPISIENGSLTIDPRELGLDLGEVLNARVTFQADDGSGAANSSIAAGFDLNITGSDDTPPPNTNTAPVADDAIITEGDDEPIVIDLNGLVSDADVADVLAFNNITVIDGRGGTIAFSLANGILTIDPAQFGLAEGQEQDFELTYTVNDGSGAANNEATGTVSLTVVGGEGPPDEPEPGANTAPVADDLAVAENTTIDDITIDLNDLISDPDGDELQITNVMVTVGEAPVSFTITDGIVTLPAFQFQSLAIGEVLNTSLTYTVDDGTGETNSTDDGVISLAITGAEIVPGNTAPVASSTTQQINVEAGIFTIDLNTLASDADGGPLTFSDVSLNVGSDEGGNPILVPMGFDPLTNIATIDPADFGLADGEDLTATLVFTVDDGTGEDNSSAMGSVTLEVTDPADPPTGPTPFTLDFEPFSAEGTSSLPLESYEGFSFSDGAVVIETDEVQGSGGRGLPTLLNGQTTISGDNILMAGADGSTFSLYAQGATRPEDEVPSEDRSFGTVFSLESMSLNAAFNDGLTVTITTYTVENVDISAESGFPPGFIFEDRYVEADSFDFIVDASTAATAIDFNDFFDASGIQHVNDAAFDDISLVEISSAGGTNAGMGGEGDQFTLDDVLIFV